MESEFISWGKKWMIENQERMDLIHILQCWLSSMESNNMKIIDAIDILNDCDNQELKESLQKILYEGLSAIRKKTKTA